MNKHFGITCDNTLVFCGASWTDENFKKGEFIEKGAYGKVKKFKIPNTNHEIVIKRTKEYCEDIKIIEGNINKYSSLIQHRNIVRYFGALGISSQLYIYMEYMPGGSLKNLIKKSKSIEHSKVIKFSKQILDGLEFIHSKRIIHRDIKPDNMLLDNEENLKLTDFGLSKLLDSESTSDNIVKAETFCGTRNYLAPEVIQDIPYGFPADIWSTGASIIHMITGKMPSPNCEIKVCQESVTFNFVSKKEKVAMPYPISETMLSFINDLLTPEQSKRPSAESLLKHSIFKDVK